MSWIISIFETARSQIMANELMAGAFWLGLMTSVFYQLKDKPVLMYNKIKSKIIFEMTIYETDHLYSLFEEYLQKNHDKKYRKVEAVTTYSSKDEDESKSESPRLAQDVAESSNSSKLRLYMKQLEDSFIVRKGHNLLIINKSREKLENASNKNNAYLNNFRISGFFAKKTISAMIKKTIEEHNESIKGSDNVKMYTSVSNYWSLRATREPRNLDKIVLKKETKDTITNALDIFYAGKESYKDKGIPYKYGMLLTGKPGNGKTSLIQSLAKKYKKNIYSINLADKDMTDSRLLELISEVQRGILVVEDIDGIFNGEKRKLISEKLSFSGLLNAFDGLLYNEGLVTIFTTNHPEKLDEALVRPGRIDTTVEIEQPKTEQVKEYYEIFFKEKLKLTKLKKKRNMCEVQKLFIEMGKEEIKKVL